MINKNNNKIVLSLLSSGFYNSFSMEFDKFRPVKNNIIVNDNIFSNDIEDFNNILGGNGNNKCSNIFKKCNNLTFKQKALIIAGVSTLALAGLGTGLYFILRKKDTNNNTIINLPSSIIEVENYTNYVTDVINNKTDIISNATNIINNKTDVISIVTDKINKKTDVISNVTDKIINKTDDFIGNETDFISNISESTSIFPINTSIITEKEDKDDHGEEVINYCDISYKDCASRTDIDNLVNKNLLNYTNGTDYCLGKTNNESLKFLFNNVEDCQLNIFNKSILDTFTLANTNFHSIKVVDKLNITNFHDVFHNFYVITIDLTGLKINSKFNTNNFFNNVEVIGEITGLAGREYSSLQNMFINCTIPILDISGSTLTMEQINYKFPTSGNYIHIYMSDITAPILISVESLFSNLIGVEKIDIHGCNIQYTVNFLNMFYGSSVEYINAADIYIKEPWEISSNSMFTGTNDLKEICFDFLTYYPIRSELLDAHNNFHCCYSSNCCGVDECIGKYDEYFGYDHQADFTNNCDYSYKDCKYRKDIDPLLYMLNGYEYGTEYCAGGTENPSLQFVFNNDNNCQLNIFSENILDTFTLDGTSFDSIKVVDNLKIDDFYNVFHNFEVETIDLTELNLLSSSNIFFNKVTVNKEILGLQNREYSSLENMFVECDILTLDISSSILTMQDIYYNFPTRGKYGNIIMSNIEADNLHSLCYLFSQLNVDSIYISGKFQNVLDFRSMFEDSSVKYIYAQGMNISNCDSLSTNYMFKDTNDLEKVCFDYCTTQIELALSQSHGDFTCVDDPYLGHCCSKPQLQANGLVQGNGVLRNKNKNLPVSKFNKFNIDKDDIVDKFKAKNNVSIEGVEYTLNPETGNENIFVKIKLALNDYLINPLMKFIRLR